MAYYYNTLPKVFFLNICYKKIANCLNIAIKPNSKHLCIYGNIKLFSNSCTFKCWNSSIYDVIISYSNKIIKPNMLTVGPGNLWSSPRSTRAQGPCRGGYLLRTNGERSKCRGHSRGWPCPRHFKTSKGRATSRWKLPPKSPMKEMRVEWDPRGGYGVKPVQGKYVPLALNAPANVLTMLMRKDAWTGWLRSQLTKSKEGQLMRRVLK